MLLTLTALVAVIQTPAVTRPDPAVEDEVVVTARRRRLTTILQSVLRESGVDQLPRYEAPVCPGVAGAPPAAADTLVRLIRQNGEQNGVRLMKEGCKANAVAIFSNTPDALVARIRTKARGYFGDMAPMYRQRLSTGGAPIRSWHAVQTVGRYGEALDEGGAPGTAATTNNFARASRLVESGLEAMSLGFVVVDTNAVTGKTLQQLADIVSMHLYLDLTHDASDAVERGSILSLFRPVGADDILPARMSAFDRGMLAGAYAGTNDYRASFVRSRIARQVARAERAETAQAD